MNQIHKPLPFPLAEARRLLEQIESPLVHGYSALLATMKPELFKSLLAAAEEGERLREELNRYKEVHLKSFNGEPGQFTVEMRSDLVPMMGAFMSDCLDGEGAENVVEWTVSHPTKGPLVMSVRRKWGKTDLELRREAVEEADALRSRVSALEAERDGLTCPTCCCKYVVQKTPDADTMKPAYCPFCGEANPPIEEGGEDEG